MTKTIIHFVLLFLAMVFVQLICNRICLFNVAVPLVFIYFIIRLPLSLSTNWVITLSFLLGLTIDIFSNTLGISALACTLIGALRKPTISLFFPREDEMSNPIPSIRTLGAGNYLKYMIALTFIYCTLIFLIQAFTFYDFKLTVLRILGSTLLTSVILFGFDSLATTRREKRL